MGYPLSAFPGGKDLEGLGDLPTKERVGKSKKKTGGDEDQGPPPGKTDKGKRPRTNRGETTEANRGGDTTPFLVPQPTQVDVVPNTKRRDEPVATIPKTTMTNVSQSDRTPCPVCGELKDTSRVFAGKIVKVLTDVTCSNAYKAYVASATKAIVDNPATAPEPMNKFDWVLKQINLPLFKEEAEGAVRAYRARYDETVTATLRQRGYLNTEPVWGEGDHLRRPQLRFTADASRSGTAAAVRESLEKTIEDEYRTMRRLVGRLEAAARVEPELRTITAKSAGADKAAEASDTEA